MKYIIFATFLLLGCGTNSTPNTNTTQSTDENTSTSSSINDHNISNTPKERIRSDIVEVRVVGGDEGNYTFGVSIKSNDTGCEQYADLWEILSADGNYVYRRVLGHSHVNEQPFTRNGEHIDIKKDTIIYIRAHMNNKGYVGDVFKGSVESGFSMTSTFDADIEHEAPQPSECAH